MITGDSLALASLVSGGMTALVPVGDATLADAADSSRDLPSEIPLYRSSELVDVFEASDNRALQDVGRLLAAVRDGSSLGNRELDAATKALRDLCPEDIEGLRQQVAPSGAFRFADIGFVRQRAERLLPTTLPEAQLLSTLLHYAKTATEAKDVKTAKLIRRRIAHRVAVHSQDVRSEHLDGLLRLAMEGERYPYSQMVQALHAWFRRNPTESAKLFKQEHVSLILQLEAKIGHTPLLYGLFGCVDNDSDVRWDNRESLALFRGDDLYELFKWFGSQVIVRGVCSLAQDHPEIFTADHVAYLELKAPFYSSRGGEKSYGDVLDILRGKRPDLFPRFSLRGVVSRKRRPKNYYEADQMADAIRVRATAQAQRPGGISISH